MDVSFISLHPTLSEAHIASNNPDGSTINPNNYIQLSPLEPYLQTSNSKVPIEMGMGDYTAELVDGCGTVLADVTENVFIHEFTNSDTGIANISFEMINLPAQYTRSGVHLKLTQTTNIDNVFFSTAFAISPETTGTVRLDYKGVSVQFGVDNTSAPFYQSVRVQGRFRKNSFPTDGAFYAQSNGNEIEQGFTDVEKSNFVIEYLNNQGNRAFSKFRQIGSKFINGYRCNSLTYSTEEVSGNSNFYKASMIANLNYDETYTPTFQIATNFAPVSLSPFGVYTLPPPIPAPTGLSYDTPNTYTIGIAITPLTQTVTGTVVSYSVSPALPTGLSINTSTGIISGTPTVITAINTYTVTATNTSGFDTFGIEMTIEDVSTFPLLHSPVFSNIFN